MEGKRVGKGRDWGRGVRNRDGEGMSQRKREIKRSA